MTDFLLMVCGALFAMVVSGIVNYKKSAWVGLTDEEINEVFGADIRNEQSGELRFIRAIEAKLKEKNGI